MNIRYGLLVYQFIIIQRNSWRVYFQGIYSFSPSFYCYYVQEKIRNHCSSCSIQKNQMNVKYSCIVGEVMLETFMHYNKNIKYSLFKRKRQPEIPNF